MLPHRDESIAGEMPVGPLLAKPTTAMAMLSCGRTRLYELIAAGELESFMDGASRKITVASIHAYIRRKLEVNRKAA